MRRSHDDTCWCPHDTWGVVLDPPVVGCNCSRPPPSCFRAGGAGKVSSSALRSLLRVLHKRQPLPTWRICSDIARCMYCNCTPCQ